jgi:hypothetical protein
MKKQRWICESCKEEGEIQYCDREDVGAVAQRIRDEHALRPGACERPERVRAMVNE